MAYKRTGRPVGHPRHPDARAMAAQDPFTGRVLGWSNGEWSGDPGLVRVAREMCEEPALLVVPGLLVPAYAHGGSHLAAYLMLRDDRLAGPYAQVVGDIPLDELLGLYAVDALDLDGRAA